MSNAIKFSILFLFTFFGYTNIYSQTPKISIQGTLKDANGAAISDGTISVIFKLYNMESTGTVLWTEEAPVNVTGGIYSHYLGSVTPLTVPMFANTLWMEVKVGGYTLTPRTELTYAPYSLAVKEVVCSGALGDVKYSVMNPTQFAAVNGDCWIPMDGRAIPLSRLKATLEWSNVPNAGGLFFRSQEYGGSDYDPERSSGTAIASFQQESFLGHQHYSSLSVTASGNTNTTGAHVHKYHNANQTGTETDSGTAEQYARPNNYDENTHSAGDHFHSVTVTGSATGNSNTAGGNETRPKNLNLWTYIRIN